MKKVVLFFALTVGLLASASTAMAQVNTSRYITLTVKKDSAIKLDFLAAAAGTPVRIVSGSNTQDITVNTGWIGTASYTAYDTTMTVYGDIVAFKCNNNRVNLTVLDISNNTQLTYLDCSFNTLSSLDISNNTQLTYLNCSFNTLSSLDISNNTQLTELDCSYNPLSSLDVSNNTQLDKLYCCSNKLTSLVVSNNTQLTYLNCYYNPLSSLDVSNNTQLKELYCHRNQLSSLDVSNNTQLKKLICWGNNFSTQVLDDIFCALPVKQASDNAIIQPIYSNTSSNHAIVLATNKTNATAKNWKVQYSDGNADIPATTGTYVCGTPHPVDTSRYITLTVAKDSAIKLDFKSAAAGTPVRIVSGSNTQDITVGTSWYGTAPYIADGNTMTVYGNITYFDCQYNGANISALVSHNTLLMWLYCQNNGLSSLDVSNNTQLTELYCNSNNLSSLDVSRCTQLTTLWCFNNTLNSLNVSGCTQLTTLWCYNNTLNSLDVSVCTQLNRLYCRNNNLTTLDVSGCTQLNWLSCHSNNFSTAALDAIYCALPDRTSKENGVINPVLNSSDPNHATVLATNAQNAIAKNWKVQYYEDDTDVPTTGTYTCSTTDIAEASAEPQLTLYPNPVTDVLYLSATARTIRVYNIYGIEVAHATDTDRIDVANLPAGVYTVKADGTVAKMVKR